MKDIFNNLKTLNCNEKIEAKIIADSVSPQGHRITTYVLTFPRFILAELNTHRVFSKNSASSRAIPFEKMVNMVLEDPFIPLHWMKDHKGMQGSEYFTDGREIDNLKTRWLVGRDKAVHTAEMLNEQGLTKQLCNRLLEPFMWHTVILTATEFDNFFELRCPKYEIPYPIDNKFYKSKKDCKTENHNYTLNKEQLFWLSINKGQSEIHMMELAECMWDARNESNPKQLQEGEWHIPFGDKIILSGCYNEGLPDEEKICQEKRIKIATARCARVSYLNFEGKDDYEADIKLYDTLLKSGHFSPFEHCSISKNDSLWYANFKGFQSLRNQLGY